MGNQNCCTTFTKEFEEVLQHDTGKVLSKYSLFDPRKNFEKSFPISHLNVSDIFEKFEKKGTDFLLNSSNRVTN